MYLYIYLPASSKANNYAIITEACAEIVIWKIHFVRCINGQTTTKAEICQHSEVLDPSLPFNITKRQFSYNPSSDRIKFRIRNRIEDQDLATSDQWYQSQNKRIKTNISKTSCIMFIFLHKFLERTH